MVVIDFLVCSVFSEFSVSYIENTMISKQIIWKKVWWMSQNLSFWLFCFQHAHMDFLKTKILHKHLFFENPINLNVVKNVTKPDPSHLTAVIINLLQSKFKFWGKLPKACKHWKPCTTKICIQNYLLKWKFQNLYQPAYLNKTASLILENRWNTFFCVHENVILNPFKLLSV